MKIGSKVFVIDKNSKYHLHSGRIIAEYDLDHFTREVTVALRSVKVLKSTRNIKKLGALAKLSFKKSQLQVIDGSLRYSSRGDLWRAIEKEKIKGPELVKVLRELREKGVLELNLPSN